jgi:hypothetical protein
MPRSLPRSRTCSLVAVSACAASAFAVWAALARAEPAGLHGDLTVQRDATATMCPDAAALSTRVTTLVGSPLVVAAEPETRPGPEARGRRGDVSLEVALSCSAAGCQARIVTTGASRGMRVLDDPDPTCAGLADALTITLAMLLDWVPPPSASAPALVVPAPAASSIASAVPAASAITSAVPAVSSITSAAPAPPAPALERASATSRPGLGVAAGGGLASGMLPSVAGLWSGELELLRSSSSASVPWVSLGVSGAPSQSLAFQGGTVTTRYLAGSLVGCLPAWSRTGVVAVGACASFWLARFAAEGSGYPKNDATTRIWGIGGLGLDARGPLFGPLGWSTRALLTVRDRDQTVSVGSLGTAAELSRVGIQARLALTMSIW